MSARILLLVLLVLWWGLGPWVPVVLVLVLALPRVGPPARGWVREQLWPERPWRAAGIGVLAVAVVGGLVVLVPHGWLPIPQAPGRWVTPAYVGRPALASPLPAPGPPGHPRLAAAGRGAPGPLGIDPDVDTGWYGGGECATPAQDRHGWLVTVCRQGGGATLHVVDAGSLRPLASKELTGPEGAQEGCDDVPFYLAADDRAIVATADRRVLVVRTSDAEEQPDLSTDHAWDLADAVPEDDCVVSLAPDWSGHVWFGTRDGLVGTLAPTGGGRSGRAEVHDLEEAIVAPLVADPAGGVYAATGAALHRLIAGGDGRPAPAWRTAYDGEEDAAAPAPVLLDGGLVALAERAEPRPHLVVADRATGREVCRVPVLAEDGRIGSMVSVGTGVVVADATGSAGVLAAVPLLRGGPALARVDVPTGGGECRVRWTSDLTAPAAVGAVSWEHGLVLAWTTRPSPWGVAGWYLTALDARTGRTAFSVRAGTGPLVRAGGESLLLADDGTAYAATRGGLVRVRDRT